ncbi:hypothetical protein EV200_10939 [Pedobacter psychrotolerans]|uniref:Uncharacterized protein n=1 Tax=Pedobacter psychrotolerans TaxID=1843235 RepID=A0A4R2H3W4_9SPHI|nr:hypothetical protein EV200_10939 [Pedobacter psychrotolerans]
MFKLFVLLADEMFDANNIESDNFLIYIALSYFNYLHFKMFETSNFRTFVSRTKSSNFLYLL